MCSDLSNSTPELYQRYTSEYDADGNGFNVDYTMSDPNTILNVAGANGNGLSAIQQLQILEQQMLLQQHQERDSPVKHKT
jgi:hypothetical protein